MSHPEKLTAPEIYSAGGRLEKNNMDIPVPEAAEKMFKERSAMLTFVERYIPLRVRVMLRERIALEKKQLLHLIRLERNRQPAVESSANVLNRKFFEKRPLEITAFE